DGLLAAIDDPNDFVCAAAIRSLGLLEAEEARNEILGFLDAHQPVIVQAAILALGRLGPPEIAVELEPFLDDDYRGIRGAAARAIGLLGSQPAGPRILDQLRACLDQPDRDDFIAPKTYIEALARLQTPGAVPLLTEIAQHEVGLRSVAVEA